MSALAQLLLDMGCRVSGSDRFMDLGIGLAVLDVLKRAGANLYPQNGAGLADPRITAVISTAIEEDNADLQKAKRLGCRVMHRAELLAERMSGKRLIAVTGTAGKTSVTGMIGWILAEAGWDPTVVNGGAVVGWSGENHVGSVRCGRSDWAVIEADESDKSLMRFQPDWVVVTNVSKDHFEEDEAFELFRIFCERASKGIVLGSGAKALASQLGSQAMTVLNEPQHEGERWGLMFEGRRIRVSGLGRHNAENAAMAAAVCRAIGVEPDAIVRGVTTFPGVERRLQLVGHFKGAAVLDDYAHNPAKIRAAWTAVAERCERVWGVWRPHGFAPLRLMMPDLAETFAAVCRAQDRLFLLPVFYVGGTARKDVSSDDLARLLRARGVQVECAGDYDVIEKRLKDEVREGDAILCMGARDPGLPAFARKLTREIAR